MDDIVYPWPNNKAYALVGADNQVINRIGWDGTAPFIVPDGGRLVLDEEGEYPIGGTCTAPATVTPPAPETDKATATPEADEATATS
ncbi:hypothetical protein [Asaia bogorensis]|uniref:hypothetical protein n=1 Tax=Asaia bogorensis TaxID=91915 RepID=UPI0028615C2A|nr:hypothetical protein [Asaia bogorensis]MDR6182066.1 hypothetical protein [Asaia bogorensis NBRC 16594]